MFGNFYVMQVNRMPPILVNYAYPNKPAQSLCDKGTAILSARPNGYKNPNSGEHNSKTKALPFFGGASYKRSVEGEIGAVHKYEVITFVAKNIVVESCKKNLSYIDLINFELNSIFHVINSFINLT